MRFFTQMDGIYFLMSRAQLSATGASLQTSYICLETKPEELATTAHSIPTLSSLLKDNKGKAYMKCNGYETSQQLVTCFAG